MTARCVTLGTLDTQWAAGNLCPGVGAADLTSCGIIEISGRNIPNPDTHYDISVIYLGDPWLAGGAAGLITDGIIEISCPNHPKID